MLILRQNNLEGSSFAKATVAALTYFAAIEHKRNT
jgi:hypothetical protein